MLKKKQMIWIVQYLNQITKKQNKKFVIREITVVMLLPVQSNLWL